MVSALLDVRNDQRAGSCRLPTQVDGDAQVDVLGRRPVSGLPSISAKWLFISGLCGQRLDDRVTDQVGEADLAAARPAQVIVDHDPVVGHQLGRHGADTRRRRHGEGRGHVRHDAGRGATQRAGGGIGYDGWRGAWP